MSKPTNLLLPVGRLLQGSLYKASDKDAVGNQNVIKKGPNAGKPRFQFYVAIGIPKAGEQHWSQTQWGALIWQEGHKIHPNNAPSTGYAWKISDGDDTTPNDHGVAPCQREGFKGHWIIKGTNGFAPKIVNGDGSKELIEDGYVNLGDYIQVYIQIASNTSTQTPGLFLRPTIVSFQAYGDRIVTGPDPKSVGFGHNVQLPVGASITPKSQGFNPNPTAPGYLQQQAGYTQPQQAVPVTLSVTNAPPYPQILNMPGVVPMTPTRIMLPKSNGFTYEQLIATGQWTDALLIQHGLMEVR